MKNKKTKFDYVQIRRKAMNIPKPTIESISREFFEITTKLFDFRISINDNSRVFDFMVGFNMANQTILKIDLNYGDIMHEQEKSYQRKYTSISSVDKNEITNFIFNALTFEGSPFYFKDGKWLKKNYIYG
jgi:hypothetical protein